MVYGAFAVAAIVAFLLRPRREAAAWCYVGGWLLLPVGVYPPVAPSAIAPIEVIGLALPTSMLISKAAVVAAATCFASLIVDGRRWLALRLRGLDIALLAWCAWPLIRAAGVGDDPATGLAASAYLLAAWGGSWLLGKLYFSGEDDAAALLKAVAWSGVALLPVALVELVTGPIAYGLLYRLHPYRNDGADRYVGHRPIALFEHGNQYGIWMAMAAFAASVLARREGRHWRPIAIALIIATLVSQSVGAIILLGAGALALTGRIRIAPRWWGAAAAAGGGAAALYLSGLLPLERIARHTAIGTHVVSLMRSTGRGSLLWRVSQDQKVMPLIHQHMLVGWGRWDWWMPVGFRPWGLPMLAVGQFGMIGLALMATAMLAPPLRALARGGIDGMVGASAIIVILTAIDAALNSFIFWPALIMAGALANARPPRRTANAVDNRARPLSMSDRNP